MQDSGGPFGLWTLFRPRRGLKFSRGGGGHKFFVTGLQRHLAALGLGDSSLYNSDVYIFECMKVQNVIYKCIKDVIKSNNDNHVNRR